MAIIQASAYIICQDEEANIARVLESVKDFAEVVLVDSGSTDKTLEIAATFANCKIHSHPWPGYAKQKQYAKSLCTHTWVLSLDADQVLSDALKQEIIALIEHDRGYAALEGPIVGNDYLLKPSHPWTRFNTTIKFFKKDLGDYQNVSVHESIKVQGRVKKTYAPIYHHGNEKIDEAIDKVNRYSTLVVVDKLKKGKKPNLLKLLFVFQYAFFKSYVLKRNFLNGKGGLIGSTCQAFYAFLKEAKLHYAKDKPGAFIETKPS